MDLKDMPALIFNPLIYFLGETQLLFISIGSISFEIYPYLVQSSIESLPIYSLPQWRKGRLSRCSTMRDSLYFIVETYPKLRL